MGWATVLAAFIAHVTLPLAAPAPPVKVLGIDETRRGKPIWAMDAESGRWKLVSDRWHTGFVDAAGAAGLLAQVEGRSAAVVRTWLAAQPEPWRLGVTHVTIDLSAFYAKAVREGLPHAVLVADRFHLVRLANDMVTARTPAGHPRAPGTPRPQHRPRLDGPSPTAHRPRTTTTRNVRPYVELPARHR